MMLIFWLFVVLSFGRKKDCFSSVAPVLLSFPANFSDFIFKPSMRISFTRAHGAFNFYQLVRANSFSVMKSRMSSSAFSRVVISLELCGFPRSVLQSLHDDVPVTIPFRDLVQIDFTKQIPDWYTPVISSHINDFDVYIQKSGNINYQGGIKL